MDICTETDELLIQSLEESEMAVEYIDSICLDSSIICDNSNAETSTADGPNVPITFILPDSGMPNMENIITLSSEDLALAKKSIKINDSPPRSLIPAEKSQNTLYTIHLSENSLAKSSDTKEGSKLTLDHRSKNIEDEDKDDLIDKIDLDIDSIKHQTDLHIMETTTRLEEFMDVVTTYRCKFCRFSCPWKSGLGSHIRNCHMKVNNTVSSEVHNYAATVKQCLVKKPVKVQELAEHGYSQSPDSKIDESDDDDDKNSSISTSNEETDTEKDFSVFLCGQCSRSFEVLEDCRIHMNEEHDLNFPSTELVKVKSGITSSKQGRPKTRPILEKLEAKNKLKEENNRNSPLLECNEVFSKRTCRPPKLLEEEYVLVEKKKKVYRDINVEKPFRCNERGCGQRFRAETHLDYHLTCHSFTGRQYICPECGECFENWRGLSLHLWKEHFLDIDLYGCTECDYKTYSTFKLDNHKKIHSNERNFVCDVCRKGFKQLSQLRNHIVIHSDRKNMIEKRWYSEQKCDICSRTFSDSKCLKKHQQAVHSKLKPFVCTFCGHMSARKAMLELHMRQHTGEKPFVCDHCDYRTGDHNSLRRHRMRHTGTKPYKCPHCPYACIQAISYKTHLKNKHPGLEGLFACNMCPFRSVSKENYFNHISDHRRGAIPNIVEEEVLNTTNDESLAQPPQVHFPEETLQQLENALPSNLTAAQLLYSCLNAMSQENGSQLLPPGVTTSSGEDGSQTITIQIPNTQETDDKYYVHVQEDGTKTAVLLPVTDNDIIEGASDMEIFQPITIMNDTSGISSLDLQSFVNAEHGTTISVDVSGLVFSQSDSSDVINCPKAINSDQSESSVV